MLKSFEIYRISFKEKEGKISKEFSGNIEPRDYDDIEKGLAAVIEYICMQKQFPVCCSKECCKADDLFTIVFRKDAMNHYFVETLSAQVELPSLENVLLGLMTMQTKIHLEAMVKKDIKLTLENDDSLGSLKFVKDSDLV